MNAEADRSVASRVAELPVADGQPMLTVRLWEPDHPFYCSDASPADPGGGPVHHRWDSWARFCEETGFAVCDVDANLLVRWDWVSWRDESDRLLLWFLLQRRGYVVSHEVVVADGDEAAVRLFLQRWVSTVARLWAPLALVDDGDR